jgi:hypothetical protein
LRRKKLVLVAMLGVWGSELKRLEVSLPVGKLLVGKASEKFVEVINILATTERTISSLCWLEKEHSRAFLRECHSSTSDDVEGNDIVLVSPETGKVVVRCEVTDVTSNKPGQNGKEKKDIKNLGCEEYVPNDGATRYIATSHEFSNALTLKRGSGQPCTIVIFCTRQSALIERFY